MQRLSAIDHVKIVRLHTRLPVVDPAAVNDELLAALACPGKAVYVALHANHPSLVDDGRIEELLAIAC